MKWLNNMSELSELGKLRNSATRITVVMCAEDRIKEQSEKDRDQKRIISQCLKKEPDLYRLG